MKPALAIVALTALVSISSCSKKEGVGTAVTSDASKSGAAATEAAKPSPGPRAVVHLKNGTNVHGSIVASSNADMIVAGDDGIERKIPLGQIKSVEYVETPAAQPAQQAAPAQAEEAAPRRKSPERRAERAAAPESEAPAVAREVYELPEGSEISVRTNEAINSETAAEGQTFDAQVTRDVRDAGGEVVIPRGAAARVVIKSSSRGGRFRGASDLVLDLQSVTIHGKNYRIETVDVTKRGKAGIGANKRTAEYTGGGAALGAIIGAIAGGGKGAAIGAGAGAGAGALTQVLTKGRAIKVPAESVLTFRLDRPLKVERTV
jgi:hypothetical protein